MKARKDGYGYCWTLGSQNTITGYLAAGQALQCWINTSFHIEMTVGLDMEEKMISIQGVTEANLWVGNCSLPFRFNSKPQPGTIA